MGIRYYLPLLILISACVSTTTIEIAPELRDRACAKLHDFLTTDLEKYQNGVDLASKDYQIEQWKLDSGDPTASAEKMSTLFGRMQKITYDQKILAATREISKVAIHLNAVTCPYKQKIARALELLEISILSDPKVIQKEKENQDLQDALEKRSNGFRIALPGKKEAISAALFQKELAGTGDRKKRENLYKLFNFARAIKWQEWGFKNLIQARNDEAALAGYKNYYEYRFYRNGLDFLNYRALVKDLKKNFAPKVRAALQTMALSVGIPEVEPWDFAYLRERAASGDINDLLKSSSEELPLKITKTFYRDLGFDVDSYHFQMDLFPKEGKNTHAFAMSVVFPRVTEAGKSIPEPPMDIRFLANLKKPVQWEDISTVIHEMGHAVNFAEVKQPYGIFRATDSIETEAIAMTFERMATSAEFLSTVIPAETKVSAEKLKVVFDRQEKAARFEQAIMLLRQVFFSDFEYEIYSHPDADYAELWSALYQQYWGIEVPPFYANWDVEHYLTAPVYVQNYAIGILMVEQFYDSMRQQFRAGYLSAALGDKIRDVYFAPGEEFNYLDIVRKFTGAPLKDTAALKLLD
jgi:Zn-dependent oligopeptidase